MAAISWLHVCGVLTTSVLVAWALHADATPERTGLLSTDEQKAAQKLMCSVSLICKDSIFHKCTPCDKPGFLEWGDAPCCRKPTVWFWLSMGFLLLSTILCCMACCLCCCKMCCGPTQTGTTVVQQQQQPIMPQQQQEPTVVMPIIYNDPNRPITPQRRGSAILIVSPRRAPGTPMGVRNDEPQMLIITEQNRF